MLHGPILDLEDAIGFLKSTFLVTHCHSFPMYLIVPPLYCTCEIVVVFCLVVSAVLSVDVLAHLGVIWSCLAGIAVMLVEALVSPTEN